MTNKPKNKHLQNKNSKNLPPQKILLKKPLEREPNLDIDPPFFPTTLEGLNFSTSKKTSNSKKRLNHQIKDLEISSNPKKSKKLINKIDFIDCFKQQKKPKSSLIKNLEKSIIPILSKQKTKKSKVSLIQNSKKTLLKKSSKHKSGGSNPVLTILS